MLFQSTSTHMCINTARPKPVVKVTPDQRVFRGETVTLTCDIQRGGNFQWTYSWFKDGSVIRRVTERVYTITSVSDNSGKYSCRGERSDSQRSDSSAAVTLTVSVKVTPDQRVFRGETVTLTCDIQRGGNFQWTYSWFKDGSVIRRVTERVYTITSVSDNSGEYSCRGERSDSQRSDTSAAVTLTVSGESKAKTKTETNSYRVKIDSVSDGGQYWCRAGRGKPVYYTQYSDALWVNVTVSPKAVVTVRPDEQVFRGETVALRCDVKWGGDTEWTYRWETEGTNYQHNSLYTANDHSES
uniref:Ig-like domain-containing protein n=1 Tax=Sinocyclocheilus rhinocerous TaxID=307959 RepID=A0A673LUI1_9TELE